MLMKYSISTVLHVGETETLRPNDNKIWNFRGPEAQRQALAMA